MPAERIFETFYELRALAKLITRFRDFNKATYRF